MAIDDTLARDIARLMQDAGFRRFVWRLLEQAGIYHSSFRSDALQMARCEGRREQGLMLLDLVSSITPDEYLLMQQEAANERRELDARRRADNAGHGKQ